MSKDIIITKTVFEDSMKDLTKLEQLEWLVSFYQKQLIEIKECLELAQQQLNQERKLEKTK